MVSVVDSVVAPGVLAGSGSGSSGVGMKSPSMRLNFSPSKNTVKIALPSSAFFGTRFFNVGLNSIFAFSAAPVAGAETGSATARSGPIPGIATPVPIQVSGRMLRLRNNRSEYPGLNFFQIETQITDGSFFNF